MIGKSGIEYTEVVRFKNGAVGYRAVGTAGKFRVRVECNGGGILALGLLDWGLSLDGATAAHYSIVVDSKEHRNIAVTLGVAALLRLYTQFTPELSEFCTLCGKPNEPGKVQKPDDYKHGCTCGECIEYTKYLENGGDEEEEEEEEEEPVCGKCGEAVSWCKCCEDCGNNPCTCCPCCGCSECGVCAECGNTNCECSCCPDCYCSECECEKEDEED